ncbi:hypothetical protein N7499_002992 [Penicillium canescens]|uniref:Uncharacterized protein n=1 Tax=Penicillium canescens TaxID=5083 RepID=A0AAD6ICJ9_PENCN|nr:hypothetical protein N7460_007223 [Penicillium canescens]KAJ6093661.1 hypothetical protein N7499_002992 [Penicillium canescens]
MDGDTSTFGERMTKGSDSKPLQHAAFFQLDDSVTSSGLVRSLRHRSDLLRLAKRRPESKDRPWRIPGRSRRSYASERPIPSQRLKFRCGVLRGSCTRQKASRTSLPAVWTVLQPVEKGYRSVRGPVPCDPGIRYHFTAARSLGLAGRERNVADESEDVERRTELYTCVGGASWRWREAEPPVRGRRGPLDHLWTC